MSDDLYRKSQPPVGPWADDAACKGVDPDLFFPEQTGPGGDGAKAKAICATCSQVGPCLEYALVNRERYGVWGGTTERERRAIRKTWIRKQAALAHRPMSTRGVPVAACGTPSGYKRHKRNGEEACEACKASSRAKQAAYRASTPRYIGGLPAGLPAGSSVPVAHLVDAPSRRSALSDRTDFDPDGVLDHPWFSTGGAA